MTQTIVNEAADSSSDLAKPEQPSTGPEQPEVNELLSTDKVIPLEAVGNSLMALKDRRFTSVIEVAGLNAKLMSGSEKHSYVRRMAALFNSTSNPFAFYCNTKPKTMRMYIHRLDRKRLALPISETHLKEQFWIVRDDLARKEKERAVTQRNYYATFEASGSDLKAISERGSTNPTSDDSDEPKTGIVDLFKTRFAVAMLGKDPEQLAAEKQLTQTKGKGRRSHANTKTSQPTSTKLPTGLTDTLGFKTQSFADQLSLNGMAARQPKDGEIIKLFAEMFNSKLTPQELDELSKDRSTFFEPSEVANLLGRADVEEFPDYLKIGADKIGSLIVTEYPRNFRFGTLFQIIRFRDIRMSVALHVNPFSVQDAESKLKSKQQLLWVAEAENKSAVGNMDRAYKIESIKQLRTVLASGDAKIFQVFIVISVRARSKKQMKEDLQRVAQRLTEMNFGVMLATRNQRRAFLTTLPIGHNYLAGEKLIADRISHPNMTGENVACLLPNCVAEFSQPGGIILGRNKDDGSLVTFNRWLKTSTNPHTVIIATTGGGKTVTQMHELMGEFLKNPDMEGYIIDIQNVLGPFCKQVGGVVIDLSLAGKACINPMDRYICMGNPETVGERLTFLYALFSLMIKSDLAPAERNAIGNAAKRLYHHFEEGENSLGVIYANFANNPFYAPLRPYLADYKATDEEGREIGERQPGIMTKLRRIYDHLTAKYQIPSTGLVTGCENPYTGEYSRPICRLYDGKWWYCGEGSTTEPYQEPEEITNLPPSKSRPPAVWYPHPDLWQRIADEYSELVQKEGIFDALDLTAREPAIRDAAIELKKGQPLLGDFLPYLMAEGAINLAANLAAYTDEELFGPVFNHYTNIDLDARFISWNCKDLDEGTLRPIRMFQVVNLIWARVRAYRKRRMFICDEFQTLVQNFTDVANFVRDLFQRGRFFRLSMTAIVQNITALLDYPQALICCQNADRIVLLRQNPLAIDRLQSRFDLTEGELEILRSAKQGEALMKIGSNNWAHVQYEIAPPHLKSWDTNTDAESKDEFSFEDEDFAYYGADDEESR